MRQPKRYLRLFDDAMVGGRLTLIDFQLHPSWRPPKDPWRDEYVYAFRCEGFVKVGRALDWQQRLAVIQDDCPLELTKLNVAKLPRIGAGYAESYALSQMGAPLRGEWFRCDRSDLQGVYQIINRARARGLAFARHYSETAFAAN